MRPSTIGSRGFLSADLLATHLVATLLVATLLSGGLLGCGGGTAQPTNADPSCYPACVANLLKACPLQGACEGTISTAGETKVCYANGIKVRDDFMSGGPEMVTVNDASGQPCYTVNETSAAGATARAFTVTANGQTVATITDNQSAGNTATINCGGVPTVLTFKGAACWPLWWNDEMRCTFGTCDFP